MRNTFLFIFCLAAFGLRAQNNTVSAGGKAVGSNGNVTYTLGQIVYEAKRSDAYSVTQGNQQPFEIVPLATEVVTVPESELKIYPNPTYSGFYLELPKFEKRNITYQLSDISGKIIRQGKIDLMQTFIATDDLNSGVYMLKIDNASAKYGSYKIIKQ